MALVLNTSPLFAEREGIAYVQSSSLRLLGEEFSGGFMDDLPVLEGRSFFDQGALRKPMWTGAPREPMFAPPPGLEKPAAPQMFLPAVPPGPVPNRELLPVPCSIQRMERPSSLLCTTPPPAVISEGGVTSPGNNQAFLRDYWLQAAQHAESLGTPDGKATVTVQAKGFDRPAEPRVVEIAKSRRFQRIMQEVAEYLVLSPGKTASLSAIANQIGTPSRKFLKTTGLRLKQVLQCMTDDFIVEGDGPGVSATYLHNAPRKHFPVKQPRPSSETVLSF
eukprot:TRINITY_DN49380_c0_g1_i1.p1 TRINITY_DN49380_c0_g1~~TRINITY_DN49380_c0_g1_i1.p1  ORF type:complete len:277 (-),score=55.01 TRINITY_DN49380_c0_g1_i1:63-893(-)